MIDMCKRVQCTRSGNTHINDPVPVPVKNAVKLVNLVRRQQPAQLRKLFHHFVARDKSTPVLIEELQQFDVLLTPQGRLC